MRRGDVPASVTAHVTAARIGPLAIVAFPLEVYSEIGLEIRRLLAPTPVIVAAYTNGLIGYAATDKVKDQGGYGPANSHRFFPELLTAPARGTDARLTAAAVDLVRRGLQPHVV